MVPAGRRAMTQIRSRALLGPVMGVLMLGAAGPLLSAAVPGQNLVTIPAGTTLRVRLADAIPVNFGTPGETYRAVLDGPGRVNRMTVIPGGSLVMVKAVGVNRSGSSDRVLLTARSVSFGGRTYDVATSKVQARGQ